MSETTSSGSKPSVRIAVAQLNFLVGDIAGNANRILEACSQACRDLDADIVVFPELALTGYPPEDLLLRPDLYDRVLAETERLKKQIQDIVAVIGLPLKTAQGIFNAAMVIGNGEILAHAFKQHLPNYSVFDEKRYFCPGKDPCVFNFQGVRVGVTICEDIWSPAPVAQAAQAGAELILNINASPYHIEKGNQREEVVRSRVNENHLPVVYANLVGGQDELVFDGDSFVINAQGEVTHRFSAFREELGVVDFFRHDNDLAPAPMEKPMVPLSVEESVYQALVTGVRDYVDKNGFNGVVIGLSGGIDSALTLAVAVDALGVERVEAVMMPSRFTSQMSLEDAAQEAQQLGVEYRVISIEPAYEAFLQSLAEEFAGKPVDTTEENIQARCRGVILMAISNKKGKIVLTTGNKSEMGVGYATLYGDMAGGFDVLKDVPKTLVYRLAIFRNRRSPIIPARVIERPPSAELAADQKDTDSLPDYEILDRILSMYVEEDREPEAIVAEGFDEGVVRRVIRMIDRNEYKRRQAAPGIRITRRAFGRDRRYPITSGFRH